MKNNDQDNIGKKNYLKLLPGILFEKFKGFPRLLLKVIIFLAFYLLLLFALKII